MFMHTSRSNDRTRPARWQVDFRVRSNRGGRQGMSLIEITLATMILAILAAVAIPAYSDSLLRYRAEATAQRVALDIALTQRSARQSNSSQTISFDASMECYAISNLKSLDKPNAQYKVVVTDSPYKAVIESMNTAAAPATPLTTLVLTFDRFGMPDKGISVFVRSGSNIKRVDVAPTSGKVSIQ
jgi:prepilin-type N-terminal cleavage/methylation domain-containing protein